MPAASTDKVRKKKSLFQTTLNGGIAAGDASLTLQSATGLPTDTAVTIVINRVDANGTATPSAMEVVTGVVSGSTVGSLVRAEDGTSAKSHANASVVEVVWDAETWNDFCDAYLTEHNQDGTHKPAAISATIVTAAAKTTPVNADSFGIVDSEASNVLKELTFTNLKAFLKTYFDTLYGALTGNQTWSGNNLFTGSLIGKLNLPEGTLINGRISVSVASNNLTLALKTLAGTDPSASDPVYVLLNGVWRSVTAALSVTKNAGTNWCASGDTRYATYERDYFAYMGYNATDGVVIGFSAIPSASQYSDFSATTTNEKYAAISTITNAASTDYYTVIGRFAATLSAGAGYTWTVPTFTAINLKQFPIWQTRYLSYLPTGPTGATITGRYRLHMNTLELTIKMVATGAMNWTTMPALPFACGSGYLSNGADASPSLGVGGYLDSGTVNVIDGIRISLAAGDTTARFAGAATSAVVSATSPITWANTDTIIARIIYEI